MNFFRQDNTENFTAAELVAINARVEEILTEMGADAADEQAVKSACDRANDEFVR